MTTRTFDRLVSFDARSRGYPIRATIEAKKPRSYTWACPLRLDQGPDGACTGFAVAHEAAAKPVSVAGITNEVAHAVYKRAQQLDEWPGEAYEGSSVIAAVKAGKERGWYGEYRWAFGVDDLVMAVGYAGPAILGINWYEGMMDPCPHCGIIQVKGDVLGGHAILCTGYNKTKKLFKLHNSWGASWGVDGAAYITYNDMNTLLKQNGEACIVVERKIGD